MSKTAKRRFCPAAKHEITSAECGEGRGSKYACPADCPFSPFAPQNYSQFLEIEEAVDSETLAWLEQETPDRQALARDMNRARRARQPLEVYQLLVWKLFYDQDADGQTSVQRWEKAGFPGLKNDGRVLMRGKSQLRVALLETRQVLDLEQVEVTDLLEDQPKPFVIHDRSFAASALRFGATFAWIYPMPHYWRIHGTAILLPGTDRFDALESVMEIVRHLGGPAGGIELRRWLAEHLVRFEAAVHAVAFERRRLMFEKMDAMLGNAVYELKRPFAECSDLLDQDSSVEDDDLSEGEAREGFSSARVWFADSANTLADDSPGQGRPLLGRVLLGQSFCRLEAFGEAKLKALRRRFEDLMGTRARFTGARLDNLARTVAEKDPKADLALVPPRLLEDIPEFQFSTSRLPVGLSTPPPTQAELLKAMEQDFLDQPVPMLQGRTPREAAKDPTLRPVLVRLMKHRVHETDVRNRENGTSDDVNWMLRELGLDEINFPAPPFIPKPPVSEDDADDFADDEGDEFVDEEEALVMDPSLPPAPALPDRPFTEQELEKLLEAALESYEKAMDAVDAMEDSGCTLIDDVDAVTEDQIGEDDFSYLVVPLVQIWHVFVPHGTRGSNLTRAALREAIQIEFERLTESLDSTHDPNVLDRYLEQGSQPILAQMMIGEVSLLCEKQPSKVRPSLETQAQFQIILLAVIEEMDRAQRQR